MARATRARGETGATVGYEAELWRMADAKEPTIDQLVDDAMAGVERDNPVLKGAWRRMNLAIRGIDGQTAHGDTFHSDRHPDLEADFILANPPFNVSDWGGERLRDDKRWQYGAPPAGNANFAWVQHIVHHLAPAGVAGFVLANDSMSSNQSARARTGRASSRPIWWTPAPTVTRKLSFGLGTITRGSWPVATDQPPCVLRCR